MRLHLRFREKLRLFKDLRAQGVLLLLRPFLPFSRSRTALSKTYVGVQIVRALLHNSDGRSSTAWDAQRDGVVPAAPGSRPRLHPILCVCHTNHALDQFLEQLVATGVVNVDDVVWVV